jgi:methyl coenzyme M reductase beta subunit
MMASDIERLEAKIDELHRVIIGNADHRSSIVSRQMTMERDIKDNSDKIAGMEERLTKMEEAQRAQTKLLEELKKHLLGNPSLLWLLRYRTRKTVFWIVVVFIILSLWWISGWRQPILEFFGLPAF